MVMHYRLVQSRGLWASLTACRPLISGANLNPASRTLLKTPVIGENFYPACRRLVGAAAGSMACATPDWLFFYPHWRDRRPWSQAGRLLHRSGRFPSAFEPALRVLGTFCCAWFAGASLSWSFPYCLAPALDRVCGQPWSGHRPLSRLPRPLRINPSRDFVTKTDAFTFPHAERPLPTSTLALLLGADRRRS